MRTLTVPFEFETPALRQIGLEIARTNGINLAQGLCMLPVPAEVLEGAERALKDGHNRYSLAQGIIELREALAEKLLDYNRITTSPDSILVTPGSTGAFEVICEAFLAPGDEVIGFLPFYPYHRHCLRRRRAVEHYIPLSGSEWRFDIEAVRAAVTPRTKFILLTNPGNPTGKVFSREELEALRTVALENDLLVVTDEVYEYLTYDGRVHTSLASLPDMAKRTITMGSYSKTFAITGWRIGYLVSPPHFSELLRTISDQIFVCPPTPLQHGVAHGIRSLGPSFYTSQCEKYARKRTILCDALVRAGLTPSIPQGAYYVIANTARRFPNMTSEQAVQELLRSANVAGVPASDFLGSEVKGDPQRSTFIRFMFSVEDAVLEQAAANLTSSLG